MDKRISSYIEDVKNDFLNKYLNEMDKKVLEMATYLGYEEELDNLEEELDNLKEWLDKEGLDIKIKEYNEYGVDMKTIYIEDRNTYFIHCMFFIQIEEGINGMGYKMSDVFCQHRN